MRNMYDLITLGNVSVDMYFSGESLTKHEDRFTLAIGGKYMVDHFAECLGGGAANVAIGVKRTGLKVAIKGVIGDNQFKHIIFDHLKTHQIPTSLCRIEKDYVKISSILLSPSGERTVIHYETPHEHILVTEDDMAQLEGAKSVYMSNLARVPLEERKKILSHLHHQGIQTSINMGITDCRRPTEQIAALLEHADTIIVNTHEFAELAKTPIDQIDFRHNALKNTPYLVNKLVVITDGGNGSYAYRNGVVYYQPAHIVSHIVDTTGAGDGYSAGFLASYIRDQDIQKAMEAGGRYAAHILQKIGAN